MKTTKILSEEIRDLKIASLPTRPNANAYFGGKSYTSADMRAAFDKLSLFIIERFNSLLEDISRSGENSLAAAMPTGISENHTLVDFFSDVTNGNLASYLDVGGTSLASALAEIREALGLRAYSLSEVAASE